MEKKTRLSKTWRIACDAARAADTQVSANHGFVEIMWYSLGLKMLRLKMLRWRMRRCLIRFTSCLAKSRSPMTLAEAAPPMRLLLAGWMCVPCTSSGEQRRSGRGAACRVPAFAVAVRGRRGGALSAWPRFAFARIPGAWNSCLFSAAANSCCRFCGGCMHRLT